MKHHSFFIVLFLFFSAFAQSSLSDSDMDSLDQLISDLSNASKSVKKLNDIKVWPGESSVRVALYPSEKVTYKYNLLKDGATNRIYIDLAGVDASGFVLPDVKYDSFLKKIRLGKRENGIRIVIETGKVESYNVVEMEEPWRIVIDYYGERTPEKVAEKAPEKAPAAVGNKAKQGPEKAAAPKKVAEKQAVKTEGKAKKKKIIVIDPGHGGKDPGAISGKLYEKDVVFRLAKKIEKLSKNYEGIEVKLTRNKDIFLPLEERAAIANAMNGDLFISLHANSFKDRSVGGMEIYHLDNTRDDYASKLARVENKISENVTLLDTILVDMTMSYYVGDSLEYATGIGKGLKKDLKKYGSKIRGYNKGALFYVLVGARMPSLLFEIGYITNKNERELLQKDEYLESIARSLLDSISKSKVK
ncbi:N-acetylmuramoyl-L-alanine amidase [bacterium]|nr:N-acetylmuramoyl-L-alanine amidase [bacterium]